ncbi:MAG: hypothetical protein A2Y17_01555 [Clostridiales bacterium GWF2_38_85]|nr:MAG: hypothetical protein A2Y17_01555 [Clostridiales bacterium GWF2_38_85]HBL84806.1 hypothetical protein [Clostridiales bacterium]
MKKLLALRKSKKGFTLVEIIVVIAIIAILAAITIPTMAGFISKANEAQALTDARAVYVAAQAEAMSSDTDFAGTIDAADATAINVWIGETLVTATNTTVTTVDGKVTALTFTDGTYTATYADGEFTTSKN